MRAQTKVKSALGADGLSQQRRYTMTTNPLFTMCQYRCSLEVGEMTIRRSSSWAVALSDCQLMYWMSLWAFCALHLLKQNSEWLTSSRSSMLCLKRRSCGNASREFALTWQTCKIVCRRRGASLRYSCMVCLCWLQSIQQKDLWLCEGAKRYNNCYKMHATKSTVHMSSMVTGVLLSA